MANLLTFGATTFLAAMVVACAQPPKLPPRPLDAATASCPGPSYPIEALRSVAEGTTQVRFIVDADGNVGDAKILQSSGESPAHQALDQEALRVVQACRFASAPGHSSRAATREYRWQVSTEQKLTTHANDGGFASPSSLCTNYPAAMSSASYPSAAIDLNLKRGEALIEFILTADGRTTNVRSIRSSHPAFAEAAVSVVSGFRCKSLGKDTPVQVPFSYVLAD